MSDLVAKAWLVKAQSCINKQTAPPTSKSTLEVSGTAYLCHEVMANVYVNPSISSIALNGVKGVTVEISSNASWNLNADEQQT